MGEVIALNKTIYNKTDYDNVVDVNFTQLVPPPVTPQSQPTVQDFFKLYEDLFFEIPEFGATNSHEYLITKSSEYINFTSNNSDIEALINEINQLRQENLDLKQQNLGLKFKS
jgi:hypothetical protein